MGMVTPVAFGLAKALPKRRIIALDTDGGLLLAPSILPGDPTGTGTGGSGKKLKAEFSKEPFKRGTIGAARSQNPDSADSQFFICFDRASHLDGQYTVWGEVVDGMDVVDKIAKGEPPAKPDKIVSLRVAADVDKQQ
jgi:cyclophilin family peptidyl-prolyl cis-trans isomerase